MATASAAATDACGGGKGAGCCGQGPCQTKKEPAVAAAGCCGGASCGPKESEPSAPAAGACCGSGGGACGSKSSATPAAAAAAGGCCKGGDKGATGCCGGSSEEEEVFDPTKPLTATMTAKLEASINVSPVMMFIKGSPSDPKCKFSKALIRFMMDNNVTKFGYFDILSDANLREALKVFSNWKTYPQLYINGKLVGGLDIIKDLHSEGAFLPTVPSSAMGKGLFPRLRTLVDTKPNMLFVQGLETKESEQAIKSLRDLSIEFDTFDVSNDATVANGLKQYGHVHTYPQLWVKSDVVQDFAAIMAGTGKRTLEAVFNPAVAVAAAPSTESSTPSSTSTPVSTSA